MFSSVRSFYVSSSLTSTISSRIVYPSVNHMVMRLKKTSSYSNDDSGSGSGLKRRSKSLIPTYKPRSNNQKQYVAHLNNDAVPIVFGIGPAGCGKTLFACTTAIDGLKRGYYQKIILTRPIVPVEEEELGFLPGSLVKKMDPWTRPIMDIFLEYYPQHEIDFMLGSGVIEISPLAYMRGRTFKNSFIVADEMQNSTPNQMLMLTTRIGEGSKMVITGDLKQSDRCTNNGLFDIMMKIKSYRMKEMTPERERFENMNPNVGIEMVEMHRGDIERSAIVTRILDIFDQKELTKDLDIESDKDLDEELDDDLDEDEDLDEDNDENLNQIKKTNNDAALIPITDLSKYFKG